MSPAAVFEIANRFIKNKQRTKTTWECQVCGARLTEKSAQAVDWDCPSCGASMEPVQEEIKNIKVLIEA
jgi:rubrerythrin